MNDKSNRFQTAVIRFENAGCIIWSPTERKYYILSDRIRKIMFKELVEERRELSCVFDEYPEVRKLLINIGVDDDARILLNYLKTKRALYAPLECYFDFTCKCNLRCEDCYNQKHLGNVSMTIEDIEAIITDLYDAGMQRIFVAGGEPTLEFDKLKAYIEKARFYGMSVSVATNGTLLTEEMCHYLLAQDIFDISVSVDGWDEKSNCKRRDSGAFERAISGVKKLVKAKTDLGSRTEICIKPIVDRYQDVTFFENMINLGIGLGVDKVKFANPERSLNHPSGYYGNDVELYYKNIKLIQSLKEKYKDIIIVTNGTNPCIGFGQVGIFGMRGCIGGQELLAINGDGRITPCLMNHYVLGNYYDIGTLIEFWNSSEVLDRFIDEIKDEDCYSCELYEHCRGGCQVRKIVQRGVMNGRDPICPIENNIPLDGIIDIVRDDVTPIRVVHSL